jgi:dTDP-glucose pyrophosphorylase
MSGEGRRFKEAGYALPKPFIDVDGMPMIERVVQNILTIKDVRIIFTLLIRKEHLLNHRAFIDSLDKKYGCRFITVANLTEGAACTVLHARKYIDNDIPLLIVNSDQLITCDFTQLIKSKQSDARILVFRDPTKNPKWSYVKFVKSEHGLIEKVAEKNPISEYATVGMYYFSGGCIFVGSAIDMIARNDRTNKEFYVCPTFNYVINNGYSVDALCIPQESMVGLGTPEDRESYLGKNKQQS